MSRNRESDGNFSLDYRIIICDGSFSEIVKSGKKNKFAKFVLSLDFAIEHSMMLEFHDMESFKGGSRDRGNIYSMSGLESPAVNTTRGEVGIRFLPIDCERLAKNLWIYNERPSTSLKVRPLAKTSIGLTRRRNRRGFFVRGNDSPEESIQVYEDVAALVNVHHRDGLRYFLQNILFLALLCALTKASRFTLNLFEMKI